MWAPDYATVEELKAYVSIPDDDTVDDTELAGKITAASRSIDDHCKRQFGQTDDLEARRFTAVARPDGVSVFGLGMVVVMDDLMDTTGLTVTAGGTAVTPDRYWPRNAPQRGEPYTRLWLPRGTTFAVDAIEVTALWGWSAVPPTVKEATLLQASRLFKRRDAPFGVAGSPDLGSEIRLLAKVDPDVAVMLHRYVRKGSVA